MNIIEREKCSEFLKEKLANANITQKQLSDISGVSYSAVNNYMRGQVMPKGEHLAKIAETLGSNIDEVLAYIYE